MKLIIKYPQGTGEGLPSNFDFDSVSTVKIGRNPEGNDIVIDDSAVSRSHCEIVVDTDPAYFAVRDLGSTNKTFVLRGSKTIEVKERQRLEPGDKIRLGNPGPALEIDSSPRPMVQTVEQRIPQADHTVSQKKPASSSTGVQQAPAPKQPSRTDYHPVKPKNQWVPIAAVLGCAIVVSGGLYAFISSRGKNESARVVPSPDSNPKPGSASKDKVIKTGEDVFAENKAAVVQIRLSWRLVNAKGNEIYMRLDSNGRVRLVRDGSSLYPFITEDSQGTKMIGGEIYASGIVIDKSGFILTCAHIAQPERSVYLSDPKTTQEHVDAYVYNVEKLKYEPEQIPVSELIWDVRTLFRTDKSSIVKDLKKQGFNPATFRGLESAFTYFEVYFPDQTTAYAARVVHTDPQQDTALIKIDNLKPVAFAETFDAFDSLKGGATVFYVGYPAIGGNVIRRRTNGILDEVPRPIIDSATVNKVGEGVVGATKDRIEFEAGFNQVGRGADGGPVFDDQGRVIGLLSSGTFVPNDASRKYVIPIRYATRLMK